MKKRKRFSIAIFCIIALVLVLSTSIIANAEDTNNKICTTEARTYFFVLGVNGQKGSIQNATYETTFDDELPETAEIQRIIATPRNMTGSDFQSYIGLINSGNCPATGPSGAPICKQGNLRSNSGSTSGWGGYEGVTTSNYQTYWTTKIVQPTQIDITCNPGSKGVVECTITRTWNDSDTSQYSGQGSYTVPAVADIVIEYEDENCGEDDDEPEEDACNVRETGLNESKGNCGTTTYEGTKKVSFSLQRDINEGESDHSRHKSNDPTYRDKGNNNGESCPTTIKQTITGEAKIIQNGQMSVTSSPHSIYAGGGFDFNVNYAGRAKYELCGTISYTTSEQYASYTCPSSEYYGDTQITYTPVGQNGRQCQKTITTTTTRYLYYTYDYYQENYYMFNSMCNSNHYYSSYYNRVVCENIQISNGGTVDANFSCPTATTGSGTCTYSNGRLSCGGCDGEGEIKKIAEEMSQYLQEPSSNSYQLTARDSNNANSTSTTASWYEWNTSGNIPNQWRPNTYATYRVSLSQKRACIDRYTANVRYTDTTCDIDKEIDGENLYYVPLKFFGNEFKIGVSLPEISMVTLMSWSFNASCGPNCYQKIYIPPRGYKFIYRPIDMSTPFPNRNEGSNWTAFMNDWNANRNGAKGKLTRNNLEYHLYLTPDLISQINGYNNTKYPDLSTITTGGKSNILNSLGVRNQSSNNYNKLGECSATTQGDKKCWSADPEYYGW